MLHLQRYRQFSWHGSKIFAASAFDHKKTAAMDANKIFLNFMTALNFNFQGPLTSTEILILHINFFEL